MALLPGCDGSGNPMEGAQDGSFPPGANSLWRNGVLGGLVGQPLTLNLGSPHLGNVATAVAGPDSVNNDPTVLRLSNAITTSTPLFVLELPLAVDAEAYRQGLLEFNLKANVPLTSINNISLFYGSAGCLHAYAILPMHLSNTTFLHYSIPFSAFTQSCPPSDQERQVVTRALQVSVVKSIPSSGSIIDINAITVSF